VLAVSSRRITSAGPQEASAACAQSILELINTTLSGNSHATLAISGGSTPKLLFGEFAKSSFDWDKLHLFWVDERGVPPTDSQSNYKLAKDHWLDAVQYPARNIHRVRAELPPEVASEQYVKEIRDFFGLSEGELPHFDIIHRGMGPDAHTASLFPGEPKIDDREHIAARVYVEKFKQWRITLLPGTLIAARNTVMLVAGDDKAEPLRTVLTGEYDPRNFPCQIGVREGGGSVTWFLDQAAARLLQE
jgi:6-phosphogluconolactonase